MSSELALHAIRHQLKQQGYAEVPSHGVSMFPMIRTGNICRFEPYEENSLRVGDILLYYSSRGVLVGHRYYRQIQDDNGQVLFICQGDSQPQEDPPFRREQIVGKLVSVRKKRVELRADGALLSAWRRMIVMLPQLIIVIHWYLRAARKLRRMKAAT